MKTRKVTVIGTIDVGNNDGTWMRRLIRIEPLHGFPEGAVGFTVTGLGWKNEPTDAPYLIVTTMPWTITYFEPKEIEVEDNTPDNLLESEVDEQITEQDISDAEWERMLNDVDTQSNTQENVE